MESSEVASLSDPVALSPPVKKRRYAMETTTSPSVSSQQDTDFEMASKQSIDSFSQQDESIEIRQSAMAPCNESSTLPLLTMGEDNPLEFAQDTLTGEHLGSDTAATIVAVEQPSQAYEGNRDSLPNLTESPSPLPGGSYLDPKGDISLPASADRSERQLMASTAEAIQYTNSPEFVDAIQDRDL